MMRFFKDFPLVSLISDAAVDFTPTDFDAPLTDLQRAYLKTHTGRDLPQVFWRKQVHGNEVLTAKPSAKGCPDADSYITDQKNLPIAIRTADCVPVFIYDPIKHVIGLVHAGWKGTHLRITAKTVVEMKEKYGCKPADLKAVLGPSIRPFCYEVGPEFKEYFPLDILERGGKMYVDVTAENHRQLTGAGLSKENIFDCGVCTYCNPGYFSFRRDAQKAGRMISVMMLL